MEHLPDTIARQDAITRLDEGMAKAAEVAQLQSMARACNVIAFADSIDRLAGRLDAFTARRDARRRADAEREAEEESQRIQAKLDALPDPDDPHAFTPSAGGELHPLPGKEEAAPLRSEDQGNLPEELQKGVPPAPGTYPNSELPKPPVVSQPVSISLNEE
jgi:hypothetical protein